MRLDENVDREEEVGLLLSQCPDDVAGLVEVDVLLRGEGRS